MAEPDEHYPRPPREVPPDLAVPTPAYKRHAWLAFASLVLFVLLYLGLTGYLGWVVYRLVRDALSGGSFLSFLWAIPPAFFFAFLVRGLFVVKHAKDPTLIEVRPEDEPVLFAFVHRIADEAGAPRPHRVFLSARVNAAVFYDLSFMNLLFPSKKNLEIGLGLVNTLSLDEIKAVIAHEFGHFAQRTMAVGRWVYIAEQIAGHVVVSRSWLDDLLHWLSSVDLRVAWIGWIMRLWVWSIRAVLDTAFRVIVLAQRALSREMELQADLVAVSVSGSDSLIHALHRLNAADEAWEYVLGFAGRELASKRSPTDLFAAHSRALSHLANVLGDDAYGASPKLPERGREEHRVFETALAHPPKMWSTHPPNREREDNAKRRYVASPLDPRSAWLLFRDPDETRKGATRALLTAGVTNPPPDPPAETEVEATLQHLDTEFARPVLDRRYRGMYLGRSIVESVNSVEELYERIPDEGREALIARIDALYPERLTQELDRAGELRRDHVLLTALSDGVLTAPGGVIRHRGEIIGRDELGGVIARVRSERDEAEAIVRAHDRAVRSAHYAAAKMVGAGWDEYLRGLVELIHYGDHVLADLRDASDYLHHVLDIVLADGHVSSSERRRLVAACHDVRDALHRIFAQRGDLALPDPIADKLEKDEGWKHFQSETFDFPAPSEENLGDWLGAIDSWVFTATDALSCLLDAALSALLTGEDHVARCLRESADPGEAPAPPEVPDEYPVLVVGQERARQKHLGWWDRFQLADGFLPGTARFAVASALLAPALFLTGNTVGSTTVLVHNGLGIPVEVSIEGTSATVDPHGTAELEPSTSEHARIVATTEDGRTIERFEVDASNAWASYVYNVAGASALVEWSAVYGTHQPRPDRPLGAPRWLESHADHVFEEPPSSVSTSRSSSGATHSVVSALSELVPGAQVANVPNEEEQRAMIEAHLRFDPSDDAHLMMWVELAHDLPSLHDIVRTRAGDDVVMWGRIEQDALDHDEACARHRRAAEGAPSDSDLAYLAARCIEETAPRVSAMAEGHARHPSHPWFAVAVAYNHAAAGEWEIAEQMLSQSRGAPELRPIYDQIALDEARVRRVRAATPRDVSLDDLVRVSSSLAAVLSVEDTPSSPDLVMAGIVDPGAIAERERHIEPWRQLAMGNTSAAVIAAQAFGEDDPVYSLMLRLAAASEGASASTIERAFELGSDVGITPASVWATIALAVREGRDATPFIELVRDRARWNAGVLLALLDATTLAADPSRMDSLLSELNLAMRGHALVMGIVLLGDAAPDRWRTEARALLFTAERPYFRERSTPIVAPEL